MNGAAVDILLSTYNGQTYLRDQIESIIDQTFAGWRLLIRDDGSADATAEIIGMYASKYSQKIKLLEAGANVGPRQSYSILGQNCSAPYVMFCDQDDFWLQRKIEISLNTIRELEDRMGDNVPLLVFADLIVTDENLHVMADSFWDYAGINPTKTLLNNVLLRNVAPGCSMIINRALLNLALPFPAGIIMHDYWCMLVASCFGYTHHIKQKLMLYRQHGDNALGARQKASFSLRHMVTQLADMIAKGCHQGQLYQPYIMQATTFFNTYNKTMSRTHAETIASFIHINEFSWARRKYALLKYHLMPYGGMDKAIFFLSF